MAAKNEFEDYDSDPAAIIAMRVLDAPRDLVWEVFTDPKHLAHWWGPIGFSTETFSQDFRVGGVWRLVMHGPDRDYHNRVVYDEIVKPKRLAFHHEGGEGLETSSHTTSMDFEEADGGKKTKVTFRMHFASAEERTRIITTYKADKGLEQTLGRLAAYLAEWK